MAKTAAGVLFAIAIMALAGVSTATADTCTVNVNCDISLDGMEIDANHVVRTRLQNSVIRIWSPITNQPQGTGTLINNLNCGADHPEPYVLTAWHVIDYSVVGGYFDSLVFQFGYLPDGCSALDPASTTPPPAGSPTITGATIVAGASCYEIEDGGQFADFLLLRLKGDPMDSLQAHPDRWSNIFYAGWSRNTSISSPVVTLGHSGGLPMKLAGDLHPPLREGDPGFGVIQAPELTYIWEIPSLEFGTILQFASGSGLFTFSDTDCKLIGVVRSMGGGCSPRIPAAVRFDIGWDPTCCMCCDGMLGNANGDGGDEPTIGDISLIIDSLFVSGAALPCSHEADANASGDISVGDLSTLMDYLFLTGTPLDSCNESAPPLWGLPKYYIDPNGLNLDSLNGWAPGETYPNWTGCQ